ncbi:MAG: signal peptidase I [Candidatus Dormibacteria bacterium]
MVITPTPQVPGTQDPPPRRGSFLRDLLEVALAALVLYVVLNLAVQTVYVKGPSMMQTLHNHDFLVADKLSYRLHHPNRGDIVVFAPSNGSPEDYIKRVIAVPGDTLKISHGQVFINGHLLQEDYLPNHWTWLDTWNNGDPDTVPPGKYFVMGDNRNQSTDSRLLGYQSGSGFLGRAWLRVWPLGRLHLFHPDSHFAS